MTNHERRQELIDQSRMIGEGSPGAEEDIHVVIEEAPKPQLDEHSNEGGK